MAMIAGIGGVFIDSNNAEALAQWYTSALGITFEDHPDGGSYFCVFATRDALSGILRENPVFAIVQKEEPLPSPAARGYLLNLRVDDLDLMLDHLRGLNVLIEEDVLVWEQGKHAWIRDGDGNRVELYEELFPRSEA